MSYSNQKVRPPLFGSPIVAGIARSSYLTETGLIIPGIIARCFQEINKDLKIEGLFRRSGATAVLNQLQEQFEQCDDPFDVTVPASVMTGHYWTGLVKRYLQLLPEPLIPHSYQPLFLESFNAENALDKLQQVIYSMPLEHRNLLLYLLQSILNMVEHSETNQMTASTMAIIMAPTCIHMDAVSQLMRQSTPSLKSAPTNSWRRAARRLLGFANRKGWGINQSLSSFSTRSVPFPLYQPQHILKLDLVKQSSQWTLVLEYLITKSYLLLKPSTRAKIPERVSSQCTRTLPSINTSRLVSISPLKEEKSNVSIDLTKLEFAASRELLNLFQQILQTPTQITKASVPNMEPNQKYVNTLNHWRAKEEESMPVPAPNNKSQVTLEASNAKTAIYLWGKKSFFTEQTMETNIPPSHLQLYQQSK